MPIFSTLLDPHSIPHALWILSLVSALGLALGHIKIRGVSLGIAGVLFCGLVFGHFGVSIDERVLDFVREFGLILFVYGVGIQVGPGFFASLRKEGLPMNLMAGAIVFLGVGAAIAAHTWGGIPLPAAVGLLAGATTNTPSLGAAQQAWDALGASSETLKLPGLGYAVAYPFGVFGIILTMLLTKTVFRIRPDMELQEFNRETARNTPPLHTANLEVTNPNLAGLRIGKMPGAPHSSVVISRLLRDGRVRVPLAETTLEIGDILLAVGPQEKLEELLLIVGKASAIDLKQIESDITSKRVIVTKKSVLGRTLKELEFPRRFGVTITRLSRMGLEFPARADLALKFGDAALLVGEPEAIAQVTRELGNSTRQLNDPQIIPLLVGIALGVLVGSLPLKIPGLPAPVRLGLAGGPLIVAILLSRLGQWRSLVWHMPVSANFMIRELGISLFLACVGLRSGGRFIETIVSGDGLTWLLWGAAITFLPLVSVAFAARFFLKTNFTALTGLLAGAMTDPPALAFANTVMNSESPAVAYATVYPVTMLLRVLSTQALLMLFMR